MHTKTCKAGLAEPRGFRLPSRTVPPVWVSGSLAPDIVPFFQNHPNMLLTSCPLPVSPVRPVFCFIITLDAQLVVCLHVAVKSSRVGAAPSFRRLLEGGEASQEGTGDVDSSPNSPNSILSKTEGAAPLRAVLCSLRTKGRSTQSPFAT